MDRYKSHKIVEAARIVGLPGFGEGRQATASRTVWIEPVSGAKESIEVPADWFTAQGSRAQIGGYLVRYEDGYISYSPAKAFEEGYTLLGA